jgi:transcriptional regulator with XRE-family HTH domain
MSAVSDNTLGTYLKDRRTKLDPATFGLPLTRRRTPGLRREEVAQRANVSATWYTWLEQGRGGAPSSDVLDRIARALMLTDIEREHIFLLALGRPPEVQYREPDGVSPCLQRVLDGFPFSPAIVKTCTWDVVGWNNAALAVLGNYPALSPKQRNVLRMMFCDPQVRSRQVDWENVARFVIGTFRADVARAGASREIEALVEELSTASPDFAAMWRDHDVRSYGEGIKHLRHAELGVLTLEHSVFAVDGRPDLGMIVYNAATPEDAKRIEALIRSKAD